MRSALRLLNQPVFVLLALLKASVLFAAEPPATACANLQNVDFSRTQDAPTTILEVKLATLPDGGTEYCHVKGYVTPQVVFELNLPTGWNGKFIGQGCGGLCGWIVMDRICNPLARKGYACFATNGGHTSAYRADGVWAYNNLAGEVDYGYRSTHVATLAAKAITAQYYGSAPTYSYYLGGSNGGRTGLIEAQRFPWDYDGLVLVAPSIQLIYRAMTMVWNFAAVTDAAGELLFTRADLEFLHQAVLAKCDRLDRLADGIIADPPSCQFDPEEVACKPQQTNGCLSAAQVSAARKVYSGPLTSGGVKLFHGAMPGSEKGAFSFGIGQAPLGHGTLYDGIGQFAVNLANSYGRYLFFTPDAGPHWTIRDFDFDADYKRLGLAASIHDASNPDLSRFKAAGGKLILIQGWDDSGLAMGDTIDYFEKMERTMGGREAAQEFARLFVVAGLAHGPGSLGPNAFDSLSHIESWVERGAPPASIIGKRVADWKYHHSFTGSDSGRTDELSRPSYPYPLQVRYKGRGDPNDFRSFEACVPKRCAP